MKATTVVGGSRRHAVTSPHSSGRAIASLSRVELRYLARHPVMVGFAALSFVFALMFHLELETDTSAWYRAMTAEPLVMFGIGLMIAALLIGSRSRVNGTDELYAPAPLTAGQRAGAQVVAVGGMALVALLAVGAAWVASGAWAGLPVALDTSPGLFSTDYPLGYDFPTTDVVPSVPELLQGPAAALVAGLIGLALARWVRTRWAIVALAAAAWGYLIAVAWGTSGDLRWFLPLVDGSQHVGWVETATDGSGHSVVQGFNVAALWWHLLYLCGVATVLTGALCGNLRRSARWRVAVAGGLAAAGAGGAWQLATYVDHLP